MGKFRTTAAYVSGAICGHMWMPDAMAGKPFQGDIRRAIDRFSDPSGVTFRDVLLHMLMENGGDFQSASFSSDTVIRIERRCVDSPGKYRVHVKELAIAEMADLSDLVEPDTFSCEFFD
jgi:hypothetical protein